MRRAKCQPVDLTVWRREQTTDWTPEMNPLHMARYVSSTEIETLCGYLKEYVKSNVTYTWRGITVNGSSQVKREMIKKHKT